MVTVVGMVYKGRKKDGDFKFMMAKTAYKDAVFIITENYHDMLFSQEDGGGTAAVRTNTWPNAQTPRAVGIPTGWSQESGGFRVCTSTVRALIDLAIDRVVLHIITYNVERVIYSADENDSNKIGVGIFKKTLSEEVRDYISAAIHDIPTRVAKAKAENTGETMQTIRDKEILVPVTAFEFSQVIRERDRCARIASENQEKLKRLKRHRSSEEERGGPSYSIVSFMKRKK